MLAPLAIATQWLVERLSEAQGGAEQHGLALNAAAVLGALQALLEDASRPGAPAVPAALPGVPSWRGALEDAFARSIELQHTWPAIALVVWRINATLASVPVPVEARPKGLGPGAMHLGPPVDEAGGLQLPLLACGALCDIAPMMV